MFDAGERLARVHQYHDGTKHHFHRFARSTGYLDWASQPHPFRSFAGAAAFALTPRPDAQPLPATARRPRSWATSSANPSACPPGKRSATAAGRFASTRRAATSIPPRPTSSPVRPPASPMSPRSITTRPTATLWSCAPRLRRRPVARQHRGSGGWLIALTSIHWRESWKYGERAFRYCQHDCGHAIAAIGFAAAMAGCRASLLPEWSHDDIAAARRDRS